MKILRIDHIGIAVEGIDKSAGFWEKTLALPLEGREEIESQQVTTGFLPVGESEIELLESTYEAGPVTRFIEKRGPGIHHIAFEVDDIDHALKELKSSGVRLIDEVPRVGAGNKRIAFIHPKATGGVLVELCEAIGNRE
jgi:methylmalonyl-CoA/ethylmalonyl-CoA epimerase